MTTPTPPLLNDEVVLTVRLPIDVEDLVRIERMVPAGARCHSFRVDGIDHLVITTSHVTVADQ